jgi:hypothetical protein
VVPRCGLWNLTPEEFNSPALHPSYYSPLDFESPITWIAVMTTKTSKTEGPARPEPVSLHPLTTEQALGALLRTPNPSATKASTAKKPPRREGQSSKAK